jgi:hypothetical protein
MSPARSTASHASVAYLRIPDFAQHGVAEEAHLKERLEKVVEMALGGLGAGEWIVLEAPEGLAVVVLANPRGAIKLAWRAGADADIAPAIGLAHGAVRVAQGQPPVLYGDALLAAEGAARATNRGEVMATRDFRDALARARPSMRRLLARAGTAVDDHGRAFEIFRADRRTCVKRRRAFFDWAGLIAVALLAAGLTIRANRPPPPPPPAPPPAPVVVVPEPLPGAVTFEVKPEGEVYVDGVFKGKSPPLKKIQLPAGNHTVEVRNGKFKPMTIELAVGPGEELAVQHNFVAPTPKPPVKTAPKPRPKPQQQPQQEQPSQAPAQDKNLWERFVDWFKG